MSDTPRTDERWEFLHRMGWKREHMPVEAIMESHEQLERELAAERALADRLAGMVEALPAYIKSTGRFGEALAAWKEARHE